MLSQKGSCVHPHLGLERETLDLYDGPGETEAQGCCGFTKVTQQVLQSWPPRHCLALTLSGGPGAELTLKASVPIWGGHPPPPVPPFLIPENGGRYNFYGGSRVSWL